MLWLQVLSAAGVCKTHQHNTNFQQGLIESSQHTRQTAHVDMHVDGIVDCGKAQGNAACSKNPAHIMPAYLLLHC